MSQAASNSELHAASRQSLTHSRLVNVADVIMGQSPPGSTYNEQGTGLPFFQGKAEFGELSPTPVKWCSAPTRIAEPSDILISVRAPVGPTNVAMERCCIGRGLAAVRPHTNVLECDFLLYFFKYLEPRLAGQGQGSTFTAINKKELHDIQVPIPTLPEQRRIVDILNRADGIRRLRKQAQDTARQLIPALFIDMFGDPATNLKGWFTKQLSELVSFLSGGTPSKKSPEYWDGEIPWVSPKDMKSDCISDSIDHVTSKAMEETVLKWIPPESVLIVVRGMILIHTVPIFTNLTSVTINQDMKALIPNEKISARYLRWALQSMHSHLLSQVSTSAHGTRKLDTGRLLALRIPLPPLNMQKDFEQRLEGIQSIMEQQEAAKSTAESGFQSLLHCAFSGVLSPEIQAT